jgi:hypothetical protein
MTLAFLHKQQFVEILRQASEHLLQGSRHLQKVGELLRRVANICDNLEKIYGKLAKVYCKLAKSMFSGKLHNSLAEGLKSIKEIIRGMNIPILIHTYILLNMYESFAKGYFCKTIKSTCIYSRLCILGIYIALHKYIERANKPAVVLTC